MLPVIHTYKLRLTNLSQRNRSLKLGSLSARKDMDLVMASFVNKLSTEELLQKIVAGKSVDLMRTLNLRDEAASLLDRQLNKVFREVETLYGETGAYDLFLGYPFVEGRFADGGIARCPVVLWPLRLERNLEGQVRWRLSVPEDEGPMFNQTFFLAYEKFMQTRLPKGFWEVELDYAESIQDFLNTLYALFREQEIPLNINNSQLFQFKVMPFDNKNAALLDQLPVGVLKFQPFAVLGIFPQSDSALLQDYEALERDPSLFPLERLLKTQAPQRVEGYVREDDRYWVTALDQSQEEALLQVRGGNSVVVHGPPGTGKSQVIVNLIADAMARGQRVLVCSQKRAALDVVYQRLVELGLGQFGALVHDFRADRNKIFQQIAGQIDALDALRQRRTDITLDKWLRDFRMDARRLDELNHYFDELFKQQTTTTRFGLSPHQLYLMADRQLGGFALQEVARVLDHDELRHSLGRMGDLIGYRHLFDPQHPWRERLSFHTYGLNAKPGLLAQVGALMDELQALHRASQPFAALGIAPEDAARLQAVVMDWRKLEAQFEGTAVREDYVALVRDGRKYAEFRKQLEGLLGVFRKMQAFKVLGHFPMRLFEDLQVHMRNYAAQKGKFGRYFSTKWLKAWWYLRKVMSGEGQQLDDAGWKALSAEFGVLEQFMERWRTLDEFHFFKDMPVLDGPAALLTWADRKRLSLEAAVAVKGFSGPALLVPKVGEGGFEGALWAQAQAMIAAVDAYLALLRAALLRWRGWLHEAQIERLLPGIQQPSSLGFALEALRNTLDRDFDLIRDLDTFLQGWTPDEKRLLAAVGTSDLPGLDTAAKQTAWLKQIENGVLLAWIDLLEQEQPLLAEVSSPRMAGMRTAYLEKVRSRQAHAAALILQKLQDVIVNEEEFNRLGNPVTYRELSRQVRKQRRLWSLRQLVAEFWEGGLTRLVPCWLASPESVAAIFPMAPGFFDLVIFDEASQCYVERALPVMLRGQSVVVAGDDKQLQPFDLYNVKVEESEDGIAENELAMEVESVLDLARNVYPACNLNWHYRSREEELIQFSNHLFYEGRLNVMPPAQAELEFNPPLELVGVEGLWDKNCNLPEAQRVIALVEELVRHPARPSIGIVTFNHPQMELIRDLLDQRLEALGQADEQGLRALLQQALARGEGEERQGIFVKNIENVQGDERDVIIFSVGYAKNTQGRLVANFGLLNQRGGENRLNVAVTRARRKVYAVCSFDPSALEVAGALHAGPGMLKRYLQYVQAVGRGQFVEGLAGLAAQKAAAGAVVPGGKRLSALLAADLRAQGLQVEESFGDTNYKVDVAVRGAGGFVLGIECEGEMYFSGRSAKEREVYRRHLLEVRGWRVHRVWARDYFLDPAGCIQGVLGRLQELNGGE
jgi:hypothetical protein